MAPSTATELPVMPTSTSIPPTAIKPSQEASNDLVGAYRVKLPPSPPDISAGYYRVVLYEDGTYTIDWSPLEAQTGAEGARGTYAVDGDQIVFTDKEGFAACSPEEGVTGTYKWSLSSQGLSLVPIDDTCAGRVYILSTKSFPPDH